MTKRTREWLILLQLSAVGAAYYGIAEVYRRTGAKARTKCG